MAMTGVVDCIKFVMTAKTGGWLGVLMCYDTIPWLMSCQYL